MPEKYAELVLYFGLCNADGMSEGRFNLAITDRGNRIRYAYGIEIVQRYLTPEWRWGLTIGDSDKSSVSTEEEASLLIGYTEANIPNSHSQIQLSDCKHGKI